MAHHGKEVDHPISDKLRKLMGDYREENENNVWPDGMMREDDEGVVHMAVGIENGRVMIRFPEPTAWIGMTPEQAIVFAESLIRKAKTAGMNRPVELSL